MNYDYEQTEFSKALLSGLFAGIFATFANLIFNFVFRDITQFNPSSIINVSSLIIISVLLVTIAGIIFYFFNHIKGGGILFRVFFIALTAAAVYYAMQVQRSSDATVSKQFQELLAGVIIILGGFIVFYVPYLFYHEKVYS